MWLAFTLYSFSFKALLLLHPFKKARSPLLATLVTQSQPGQSIKSPNLSILKISTIVLPSHLLSSPLLPQSIHPISPTLPYPPHLTSPHPPFRSHPRHPHADQLHRAYMSGTGNQSVPIACLLACLLARSFLHSRTHALTHSRTHALTHSLTHSLTYSLDHALTHART